VRGAFLLVGNSSSLWATPVLRLTNTVVKAPPVAVGGAAAAQTVEIFNGGDGSLAVGASVSPVIPWLTVSVGPGRACTQVSGVASCIPLQFNLSTASLEQGTYSANVTVFSPGASDSPQDVTEDNLTGMEREHIVRVLRETHGVLSGSEGAASRLGIKRTTLQSMLKRFNIELDDYRRGTGTFGGR